MTEPDPNNTDQTPTSDSTGQSSSRMFAPTLEESSRVPETVGGYKLEHRIGRGGMGSVYAATRIEAEGPALQARAAVKLLRRGIDTEDVLRRFALERHVLGALDHPNIARFFDAGETPDGLPYVVMELVEGQPIDKFCDANNLSIEDRLQLFGKVCSAAQYAHTNLIVHRDLKPANILVTPDGEPKLLDFGIAKILNPHLAVAQLVTGPSIRLMTPEYASPEQVRGEPVTTTSDIYSLGVLLYELLTGVRPYRIPQRVEREIVRIVCDSMPDRPSTAFRRLVSETGDGHEHESSTTLADIARKRSLRPAALRSRLSGDLDDIIMTALSKTPSSRYPSANDLAADINRYLKGQPVTARKVRGRNWYTMRKFVKRNKTAVAATLAAVVALTAGGTVAAVQRSRAVSAQRDSALAAQARLQAEVDAQISSEIGMALWDGVTHELKYYLDPTVLESFHTRMIGMLSDLETEFADRDSEAVRIALLEAKTQLAGALGGVTGTSQRDPRRALAVLNEAENAVAGIDPTAMSPGERLALAGLLREKGNTLRDLDHSDDAKSVYEQALTLLDPVTADATVPTVQRDAVRLAGRIELSMAQLADRVCNWSTASTLYTNTIARRQAAADAAPDDLNLLRDLAIALGNQGDFLTRRGDFPEAEDVLRRSLSLRQRVLQRRPEHPSLRRDVAIARLFLGTTLSEQGLHADALDEWRLCTEILRALHLERPSDARIQFSLAAAREAEAEDSLDTGNADTMSRAVDAFAQSIEDLAAVAPNDGALPRLRAAEALLRGRAQLEAGEPDAARRTLRVAYDLNSSLLAADPQRGLYNRNQAQICTLLGDLTLSTGDPNAAAAWYRRAGNVYDDLAVRGRLCGVDQAEINRVDEILRTLSP